MGPFTPRSDAGAPLRVGVFGTDHHQDPELGSTISRRSEISSPVRTILPQPHAQARLSGSITVSTRGKSFGSARGPAAFVRFGFAHGPALSAHTERIPNPVKNGPPRAQG